ADTRRCRTLRAVNASKEIHPFLLRGWLLPLQCNVAVSGARPLDCEVCRVTRATNVLRAVHAQRPRRATRATRRVLNLSTAASVWCRGSLARLGTLATPSWRPPSPRR